MTLLQFLTTQSTQYHSMNTVEEMHLENRILGCIYGNCIGDAIGLLTEFMTRAEAQVVC